MKRHLTWALITLTFLASPIARADDWQPPSDKKFTEAGLTSFLPCLSDWVDSYSMILRHASTARTDTDRLKILTEVDKNQKDILEAHRLSDTEFNWMQERVTEAWTVMNVADKVLNSSEEQLTQQTEENNSRLTDAKKRLAQYLAARKAGVHVLSAEDCDAAIKSAKDDQQVALDEVKQHLDDAAAAEAEAKQHDEDAETADDLVSNPPADVSTDDRQAFIDKKKSDAAGARDAARDARSREADANGARVDAQAKADAAAARAQHPEVPLSDDDKAATKAEDDGGVASAQADIENCKKNAASIADARARLQEMAAQFYKDVPQENIELMRKHFDEYKKIADKQMSAATMPSRQ